MAVVGWVVLFASQSPGIRVARGPLRYSWLVGLFLVFIV